MDIPNHQLLALAKRNTLCYNSPNLFRPQQVRFDVNVGNLLPAWGPMPGDGRRKNAQRIRKNSPEHRVGYASKAFSSRQ
jgi:hypothetical protein